MPASNMYQAFEALQLSVDAKSSTISPKPDRAIEENTEEVHSTTFNLVQLQDKLGTKAVFTTELLEEIKNNKIAIEFEMRNAPHTWTLFNTHYQTRSRKYKTWSPSKHGDDEEDNYKCVTIRLMSRIEMHPDFQAKFWKLSRTNRILRRINKKQSKKEWLPVPYAIKLGNRAYNGEHLNNKVMLGYWHALMKTNQLWYKSSSRAKILQMADKLAIRFEPITKIVCFGLGALSRDPAWYESSLQHMTAFSIAHYLEQTYRKNLTGEVPVEVILQDPCYTQKDQDLLRKMYHSGTLTFASDPEGLLAIDANTIVMTAFLPIGYPLMQIMADMFHGKNGEGPTAIICDSMDLDPAQELYTLQERASPEVARFLTREYDVSDFKDHLLESELAADVFGDDEEDGSYWLSSMQLYTRRTR